MTWELQIGVKMTKEPPKGVRANLRSTFAKMDDDKLKRTCKPADFRKMLFGKHSNISFDFQYVPLIYFLDFLKE